MRSWCQQVLCRDIRHSYHDKNKTVEYNLCSDIIKVYCNTIQKQTQRTGRDRIQEAMTEVETKIESSVAIELSMSRQRDQFGPEFWESTTQLMK